MPCVDLKTLPLYNLEKKRYLFLCWMFAQGVYTDVFAVLLGLGKDEVVVNQTSFLECVAGAYTCFDVHISIPVLSEEGRQETELNAQKLASVLSNRQSAFSKRVGRLINRWLSQFFPGQLVWDLNVLMSLEAAYVLQTQVAQSTPQNQRRRLFAESQILSIIPKNLSELARTQYVSNGIYRSFPFINNADMIIDFVAKEAPADSDRARARLIAVQVPTPLPFCVC